MSSFRQRFKCLMNVIQLKQKASKAKSKLLSSIISKDSQIGRLKKYSFHFDTTRELFKQLILINTKQLAIMLVFSLISLIFRLFCASINTFIIQKFEKQHLMSNLMYCILLLVVYKIVKAGIDQWSSYLQMNYGFKGYSALYYHFLYGKTQMTGQVLNIIEDDMEKISTLPYSIINFPFLSILIIVLTVLLSSTLQSNIAFIVIVSLLLYAVNCIGGVFIFHLNQKLMNQKDFRLSLNLVKSQNPSQINQARRKQVSMVRTFLLIKVVVKWFVEVCFVLLYGLVFLWNQQVDKKDDQLYYRLMLLGMLKIAFNSLFMESYYIALVLNSLKRIIICQNRSQIQKSTIGCYEDFVKKKQQIQPSSQTQRQSTESSQYSQNSMNDSYLKPSDQLTGQQSLSDIQIKSINLQKLTTNSIKTKKKYSERGQIKLLELLKYIKANVHSILLISLLIFGLVTLYTKLQNLKISHAILHNEMSTFQYFIFVFPVLLYTVFYLSIILTFSQVSQNLFKNLSSQQIQGQDLNRISGDIQMVDKYVPPALFQFCIVTFGLLASLILTVQLIKDAVFAIITALLILFIIGLSIYFNRYFMKSRRQIKRLQCRTKSSIIQAYAEHIALHTDEQIPFNKVSKNWKKINVLKNIGIAIENSYIFLLNLLVLLIQVLCFIICFAASLDSGTTKLILVFILQLDLSLTGLLLNTIYLEMGLVNFERCLNFVKKKMSNQNLKNYKLI